MSLTKITLRPWVMSPGTFEATGMLEAGEEIVQVNAPTNPTEDRMIWVVTKRDVGK